MKRRQGELWSVRRANQPGGRSEPFYSRRAVGLPAAVGDEQRSGGPGAAGVRMCVPGFGVAVVQVHQVQLSLMTRQLEEQRCAHFPARCLEVFVPTAVHSLWGVTGDPKPG